MSDVCGKPHPTEGHAIKCQLPSIGHYGREHSHNSDGVAFVWSDCQEVIHAFGDNLIRCGGDPVVQVAWEGRAEGPYWLCLEHGDHYIRNRGAGVIAGSVNGWKGEK